MAEHGDSDLDLDDFPDYEGEDTFTQSSTDICIRCGQRGHGAENCKFIQKVDSNLSVVKLGSSLVERQHAAMKLRKDYDTHFYQNTHIHRTFQGRPNPHLCLNDKKPVTWLPKDFEWN